MVIIRIRSVWFWGVVGASALASVFYLVQVLGMQDWSAPIAFMRDQWYFVGSLIVLFGVQTGLFRAIHLRARHGGGGTMVTSGSVASGTMLACCMHNLTALFPVLGISALATFFAAYQTQAFLFSIAAAMIGTCFMIQKYRAIVHDTQRS